MPSLMQSIPFNPFFALAPLLVAISGCGATPAKNSSPSMLAQPNRILYPSIDSGLGEKLYPNEKAIAEEISDIIEQSIRQQYALGSARRDAHPKAHGCVRAEFHVMETLPNHLAKGVFIPGKTYQAWIRFSNGSRDATRADIKGDARGMAIKIMGVSGKKILEE